MSTIEAKKKMAQVYHRWLTSHPMLTKTVTACLIFGAGDGICQGIVYQKNKSVPPLAKSSFLREHWNPRRTLNMALLGLFVAPYASVWFRTLEWLRPDVSARALAVATKAGGWALTRAQWMPALQRMAIDQSVNAPFSCALFFVLIGGLEGQSWPEIKRTLDSSWATTLMANYCVWPLAVLLMFRFVPSAYRVLFANVTSLFWNVVLSFIRYERPIDDDKSSTIK
jgi:protein Mpv17